MENHVAGVRYAEGHSLHRHCNFSCSEAVLERDVALRNQKLLVLQEKHDCKVHHLQSLHNVVLAHYKVVKEGRPLQGYQGLFVVQALHGEPGALEAQTQDRCVCMLQHQPSDLLQNAVHTLEPLVCHPYVAAVAAAVADDVRSVVEIVADEIVVAAVYETLPA